MAQSFNQGANAEGDPIHQMAAEWAPVRQESQGQRSWFPGLEGLPLDLEPEG